ncbi:MAG: hypothetical protein V5A34_00240 [Halapricum sp.]
METCEEQAEEMVDRCATLFTTFEDFFVPTELDYYIHRFPADQRLPVGVNDEEHIRAISRELLDESGITADTFRESAQVSEAGSRWIPRIAFDKNNIKVTLEDGEVFASKHHYSVEYHRGEPVNNIPSHSPLELKLLHGQNIDHPKIDSDYETVISVSTTSDIWFDEAAPEANRRNLSELLKRIDRNFPVQDILRSSDSYPLSHLEEIY